MVDTRNDERPEASRTLPPPARIYGIVAREAPICVVFRRGPTEQVQVLKWNTETDELTPGQWFKGKVYVERGDLSPDGTYMTYFAAKRSHPDPVQKTYTVISRPPYLTALALWFKGDSWGGGALFESARHVLLNDPEWEHRKPFVEDSEHRCQFKTSLLGAQRGEAWPIEKIRMERDGWICNETPDRVTLDREIAGGRLRLTYQYRGPEYSVIDSQGKERLLSELEWADVDCNGAVLGARNGKLLKGDLVDLLEDQASLIADLSPNRFESVVAPDWAVRWD